MKSVKIKKTTFLFFFILGICFFVIKSQFFFLPLHNDEFNHMEGVVNIVENNFFPFVEWWSYHPPLIFELVALTGSFLFFNNWILAARLTIALFGFLTLVFTFFLGKSILKKESVGFLSAILLFFLPIFQAQSSLFHLAIPFTCFFLAFFYFYLKEKWLLYLLFGSFLVLTKEPAVIIIFILGIFDFLTNVRKGWRKRIIRLIIINLPQFLFIAWMLLNKRYLNWYLWPYNIKFFSSDKPYQGVKSLLALVKISFWEEGIWILTLGLILTILFSVISKKFKNTFFKKEIFLFFFTAAFFCLFFYIGAYLPRYILFIFPLLIIVLAAFINEVIKFKQKLGFVFLFLVILVFCLNWFHFSDKPITWAGERNYAYVNIILNHKKTVDFVNNNLPQAKIISHYPFGTIFNWRFAGYVKVDSNRCLEIDDSDFENLHDFKGVLIVSDDIPELDWAIFGNTSQISLLEDVPGKGVRTRIYGLNY